MSEHEPDLLEAYDDDENLEDTYLTFNVGGEEYALPVMHVTEIIRLQHISEVPDMPDCFRGVINLRGKVIPIMDVRSRFRLAARDYDDRTVVVVLEIEESAVGLVVDAVSEVTEILPERIDPAPQANAPDRVSAVRGMAKREGAVSILLDINRLVHAGNAPTMHQASA